MLLACVVFVCVSERECGARTCGESEREREREKERESEKERVRERERERERNGSIASQS